MKKIALLMACLMVILACASCAAGNDAVIGDKASAQFAGSLSSGSNTAVSYSASDISAMASQVSVSATNDLGSVFDHGLDRNYTSPIIYSNPEAMVGGNQMRVISVSHGTYAIFYRRTNILRDDRNSSNTTSVIGLNEFRIVSVRDGVMDEMYVDYNMYDGLNFMADDEENVYFVTGASGRIYRPDIDEEADMTVWSINSETDRVTGYTTRIPFESNDLYNYSTAVLDNTNNCMYVFFAGGDETYGKLAWGIFDLTERMWQLPLRTVDTDVRYDFGFGYEDNGEIILVGESIDGSAVKMFKISDPTSADVLVSDLVTADTDAGLDIINSGDAYWDAETDILYLMYQDAGVAKFVVSGPDNQNVITTDIAATAAKKFVKNAAGKLFALVMPYGETATIEVWAAESDNSALTYVTTKDVSTIAMGGDGFNVGAMRNGSTGDTLAVMYPDGVEKWYQFDIALPQ